MQFLIIWLIGIGIMWILFGTGVKQTGLGDALPKLALITASASSLILLIVAFHLLGMSPTVQYNAGSDSAMNLWSSWVKLWPIMLVASTLFFLWTLGILVSTLIERAPYRTFALISVLVGFWQICIMFLAAPSA